MTRAPLDLRYEHEFQATVSRPSTMQPHALFEARSLIARLSGLKALMDAERDSCAAWIAAKPSIILS